MHGGGICDCVAFLALLLVHAGPVTCAFSSIIAQIPFATVKPSPKYVLSSVTDGGSLDGNICVEGSADPFQYCPAGSYCPNASSVMPCPKGYFCPAQSVQPVKCGALLDCSKAHLSKPPVRACRDAKACVCVLSTLCCDMSY